MMSKEAPTNKEYCHWWIETALTKNKPFVPSQDDLYLEITGSFPVNIWRSRVDQIITLIKKERNKLAKKYDYIGSRIK